MSSRSHRALLDATRALALTLLAVALPALAAAQETIVPERYAITLSATDLPGNDRQVIYDVTLERCHVACLRDRGCAAFTFDQRNGVCFLKEAAGVPVAFEGAFSGVIAEQGAGVTERARAAAADLAFLDAFDFEFARARAQAMAEDYPAEGIGAEEWLRLAGRQSLAGEIAYTGAAITASDSGEAWFHHARALADQAAVARTDVYDLYRRAGAAAINAVLRSEGLARAEALLVLARALEGTYRGSLALDAVKQADRLSPNIAPELLARLQEAHGFRVLSHDVDASTASPRICVTFSEELTAGRDYAQFVQRAAAALAVEAEGQQLCLSGVVYGQSYSLTLRAGLPSAQGETLTTDVPLHVYVRDRSPSVSFPGRAYVLPARGPRALPVETVNAGALELTLLHVADRNLVTALRDGNFLQALSVWEGERFESLRAETVWSGEAEVASVLNQATVSLLPLDEIGEMGPGVYVLRAWVAGSDPYEAPPATQWFIVSDLGITTLSGADGVHVVVQRLSDARPAAGVNVSLVARSNRVLAELTTDAQGHVAFPATLALGIGNAAPAMVMIDAGEDFAMLSLEESEFDLTDRGVAGREAPGPLDVFLTPDRGVYRPGETVNLTILTRDAQARAVTGLPLTVRLLRPDGVEYASVVDTGDLAGGHVIALQLGNDVPRGAWRVETLIDPTAPPLVSRTLLVEDFIPERIDVEIALPGDGLLDPAAAPSLLLSASHLFGAPAAGMSVSGSVRVAAISELPNWPGYSFGRFDQRTDTQMRPLIAGLRTDGAGHLEVPLGLERLTLEARPFEMTVIATVSDGASRPVERSLTRTLRPTAAVVGIRPSFEGPLPEGSVAEFDLVIVDPDGTAGSGEVTWQVDRVETRYQWYSVGSNWYWEPVTERQRVLEGSGTITGNPVRVTVPVAWGTYEIRATSARQPAAGASLPFAAGWAAADATRETPDLLAAALDKASYEPGEVALLRLAPEVPGVALVSVLAGRVIDLRLVEVDGETTIELPVTAEWGAGAYVTASLVRPSDGPEHLPGRSLGLAHAAVAPGERALTTVLTAPAAARSGATLNVTLAVPDIGDGPAYATVAAVDLGILNLTGFEAPDPEEYYFGQRRLGVAIRDLYGRLIDARQGALGEIRSGGDAGGEVSSGPVPAEDLLAFFSGPVELVAGRAEVAFDLPAFAGTVRLMAVVWTDEAVGHAEQDVLVRDPVVVQASLPRFLAPGDVGRLRLELTHASGAAGALGLAVSGHGLANAPEGVEITAGGRAVLDLALRPSEPGEHVYRVAVTTPDGEVITREVRLTVQRTDPETARSVRFELPPGGAFTFDAAVLDGFWPDTARATLASGFGALLDTPGLIMRLAYYPYGCTEQIASSLQPLLLAPAAVTQLGLASDAEARVRLQSGVDRIITRQGSGGGFGLWSAGGFDLWLDAYATDVLLTAEAKGADVPDSALRQALDNLRNQVARAGSLPSGSAGYAYAFYVLARAGEAVIGDLRYYADVMPDSFDTPLSAAHLGAALAAYGERERSEALFERAQALALAGTDSLGWRSDYGTELRDRAGLLALAIEAGSSVVDRARLATLIAGAGTANTLSPQEAAWTLKAAVASSATAAGLELAGRPVTDDVMLRYDGAPTVLTNTGSQSVTLTLTTFGVPIQTPEAGGVGYQISRSHYTPDGESADLTSVRAGDRLVVVLEVRPDPGVPGGRLIIDDALPAGFEIDNANLLRSGDVRALDWLALTAEAEATEARSDRFLAAVDWTSEETLRLAYFVRAVTPGSYHYPAPLVEDLYRPINRAVGETGRLEVGP